jgi:hypothetical protein
MMVSASLLVGAVFSAHAAAAEEKAEPRATSIELAVIVSDEIDLTEISMQTLQRIFTQSKVALPGGATIIPINSAPHSPERTLFDRVVLGMDPDAVGRFWIDQKIRGVALPPKFVNSTALAGKLVERVKGAITYVPASHVPAGTHALTIDGRRPGERGYSLVGIP